MKWRCGRKLGTPFFWLTNMLAKRRRIRLTSLALALIAGVSTAQAQTSRQGDFFFCKSRDFNIPFNVGAVGRVPSELELEVSSDGGASWQIAQRSSPNIRSFHYLAPADGLYLFRLKTIDSSGRAIPSSDAPMQVIIDTDRPQGELSVDIDGQGKMIADFLVVEPHLNAESVRIEYRSERDQDWHHVPSALQQGNHPFEVRGTASFELPLGAHQLMIRLTAVDMADNRCEVFRYPDLPKTANAGGTMTLASQRGGARSGPTLIPQTSSSSQTNASLPPAFPPNAQVHAPQSNLPKVAGGAAPIGTGVSTHPLASGPSIPLPPVAGSTSQPQSGMGNVRKPSAPTPGPKIVTSMQESQPQGQFVLTEVTQEDIAAPPPLKTSASSEGAFQLPNADTQPTFEPDQAPFYSNSRTFSLDYELEVNPGIGVQSVELWGTTDGGKTWDAWGPDPDRRSPMDVAVEEDGLFGFRIVILSSAGVASNRPIAGDTPDMWVLVDAESPVAQLTSAQYGVGNEQGGLVLEYLARDHHLADRPVSLSFSETPRGPWITIASGLPNQGRYLWTSDAHLPRHVFLKLDVMDKAGNVGTHQIERAIDIQGLTPRGRIQSVRPIKP